LGKIKHGQHLCAAAIAPGTCEETNDWWKRNSQDKNNKSNKSKEQTNKKILSISLPFAINLLSTNQPIPEVRIKTQQK